jgi:hypothetical protein
VLFIPKLSATDPGKLGRTAPLHQDLDSKDLDHSKAHLSLVHLELPEVYLGCHKKQIYLLEMLLSHAGTFLTSKESLFQIHIRMSRGYDDDIV